jgi:transposase
MPRGGFDGFAEGLCAAYYAARRGRPSLPPGRYFRMLLVSYFEGIDSERGLEWRCADSLSLREFLRLGDREPVPALIRFAAQPWLSRTRDRLPLEVHDAVLTWVLQRLAERGLVRGERIGVDASTTEANAALRAIVRRQTGEGHREMLTRMTKESGIETPAAEDLMRLDRARKGKRLSNAEWESPTDLEARIAKLKDGRTHLAYKPEYVVDLDTGAVVAAEIHLADRGDTATLSGTLESAACHLAAVEAAPSPEAPTELVADQGYLHRPWRWTLGRKG